MLSPSVISCSFTIALAFGSAAIAQPTITNLGVLTGGATPYSYATAISADGTAVAGYGSSSVGQRGFRWTALNGLQPVGVLSGFSASSVASGVSADGFVVSGSSSAQGGSVSRAFRWTDDSGMQNLGVLGTGSASVGRCVSGDGLAVAGSSYTAGFTGSRAARWTFATGLQSIAGEGSSAAAINTDGSIIVGTDYATGFARAARWTIAGGGGVTTQPLAVPSGSDSCDAYAVTGDGAAVVGTVGDQFNLTFTHACRWTNVVGGGPGVVHDLGTLGGTGHLEGFSYAYGVGAHGHAIVGASTLPDGDHAFLWTPLLGMVDLNTYLPSLGLSLAGWTLSSGQGISADGTAIAGNGLFNGAQRAFLIRGLPAPCEPLCAADFNCSRTLEVQDIFDFLNSWFSGSGRADLTGDGLSVQDIFDFLNAWFLGC